MSRHNPPAFCGLASQIVFKASCNCPKTPVAPSNNAPIPITTAKPLPVDWASLTAWSKSKAESSPTSWPI